jgi:hypothetical protein
MVKGFNLPLILKYILEDGVSLSHLCVNILFIANNLSFIEGFPRFEGIHASVL